MMKGQVAFVTGGARGIGQAISVAFARSGCNLVIADIDLGQSEQTAEEIRSEGVEALAVQIDVSSSESVSAAFKTAMEKFGRVDILINNAGITRDNLIMRMKEEDWNAVLDINLKGVFLCSKEVIKIMSKQKYGRIVNIASVVAFMGNPGQANYSASKAGIIGLTKTTAKEYASRGITANAVAPGFIVTAMTDALPDNVKEEMMKSIPLGKFGTVDDVANAVVFLSLPGSGYVTGQVIHVNGGMYM
ncbi:MAG: 3-oxoacyl-[acyl-carrier-protein] reductase [Nitrospirota bacterium]|nr:MAG: 3-oxoacyl-[acyl-carrier-protein] reductase [Nitrospirota bacterium]